MQTLIEQRRQADYERYRLFSMEQLLEDEATFAGENLKTHNVNVVAYQRDEEGCYVSYRMNDGSERKIYLRQMAEAGVAKYSELADRDPSVAWQRDRCVQEKAHVDAAENMPSNSLYVVVSDCPQDELERHGKNMFGYSLERKRGFLQFLHTDEDGDLRIYSHSFDGNDQDGIAAMYGRFGQQYDTMIRALEQPMYLEDIQGVNPQLEIEATIATYDMEQFKKDGVERFAGIPRATIREEGNTFVRKQTDLLKEHCEKVLFVGSHTEKAREYRYEFAVAVRKRFDGEVDTTTYHDAGSELSGAGESGRESGEMVDACGNSLTSATSELSNQGFSFIERFQNEKLENAQKGECRACFAEGLVGSCAVCLKCQTDNTKYGVDLAKRRKENLRRIESDRALYVSSKVKKDSIAKEIDPKVSKAYMIKKRYGQYAVARSKEVLGGAKDQVYDSRTNQLIEDDAKV